MKTATYQALTAPDANPSYNCVGSLHLNGVSTPFKQAATWSPQYLSGMRTPAPPPPPAPLQLHK